MLANYLKDMNFHSRKPKNVVYFEKLKILILVPNISTFLLIVVSPNFLCRKQIVKKER